MRKFLFFLSVITVVFAINIIGCAAMPLKVNKILLETPIYSNPDFNSELVFDSLKQNEIVEIKSEVIGQNEELWLYVSYKNLYEGYIPKGYVYKSANNEDYSFIIVKVTGKSTDDVVNVYLYYDKESAIAGTVYDGQKILKVEDDNNYGEFTKVLYNGKYCYVKNENITLGLTYNQKLAIVFSAILLVVLVGLGVGYYKLLGYRRKNYLAK